MQRHLMLRLYFETQYRMGKDADDICMLMSMLFTKKITVHVSE